MVLKRGLLMKNKILRVTGVVLLVSSGLLANEVVRTKWIDFKTTQTETTIFGRLDENDKVVYKLKARKNQIMQVKTESKEVYFDILAPNKEMNDATLFSGKTDGNRYSAKVEKTGEYTIRMYLKKIGEHTYKKVIYSIDIGLK